MSADRTTKTLLVLICVALWGIVLQPLFKTENAFAQSRKVTPVHKPTPDSAQTTKQYDLQSYDVSISTKELTTHLRDRPKAGWHVNSMNSMVAAHPIIIILWEKDK